MIGVGVMERVLGVIGMEVGVMGRVLVVIGIEVGVMGKVLGVIVGRWSDGECWS